MKRKGFTLIELLAVIVVLAIIALIATPIVLNIIENSKDSSNKRSIELYGSAVEQAVAREEINGNALPSGKYTTEDGKTLKQGDIEFEVDYKGSKVVCDVNITSDGEVSLKNCKVNGKATEYTYGDDEIPTPKSFGEDSWETIVANVKAGNTSAYKVGDTKEIKLEGFTNEEENSNGLYTIRITNNSTPEECNTEGFSQTACGFVIEFVDIITRRKMNPSGKYKGTQYGFGWNVDGWPASEMRTYVNNNIYNALPEGLKENIINTKVVSSHGSTSGETNFTSEDKIYLLSTKEVWGKEGTTDTINYDTAESETRQLDYYKANGVTTANYSGAIKNYNGSPGYWWLRSAYSYYNYKFYDVSLIGLWNTTNASDGNGVAVAFRI